uniref:Non-structural maintenance of chromosome element 4 C-terminal domain-containing protein n=2 Tax=Clastoptera arizonana TaxID=38151 RepID=A0A1B6CDX9_9HEMI
MNEQSIEASLADYSQTMEESLRNTTDEAKPTEVLKDAVILSKATGNLNKDVKELPLSTSKITTLGQLAMAVKGKFFNAEFRKELQKYPILMLDRDYHFTSMIHAFPDKSAVVEEKVVKQRAKQTKDVLSQKIEAKKIEINENQIEEVRQTNIIYKALKNAYADNGNKLINFHEFVLNPDSYTLTRENIFYLAFLIRDNLAVLKRCLFDVCGAN